MEFTFEPLIYYLNFDSLFELEEGGRITPLHYVAEVCEVDLLAEFLLSCPSSIEDLTITGETAVHVAVKNRRLSAFKVLLGLLQRTDQEDILNWKDEKGNTVLHIATSTNQTEVVELLAKEVKVKVNALNHEGATALDIAMTFHRDTNAKIRKTLQSAGAFQASSLPKAVTAAEFLSSHPKPLRETMYALDIYLDIGLSGDMRNALLVVAVLIATATYQALLQPPGGYSQQTDASSVQHESQLEDSHVRLTMSALYFYPLICLNSFNRNNLLIISARTFRLRKRLFPTMRILNDSSINPFSSLREQQRITRSVLKKYCLSVAAKGEQVDINGT
ncbi:hypothetical protein Leryth_023612 [Lithospermum erythrorhizon]|nr:hypothetical protein Leryth_023612 [Lithospermum erythrorhizon]